MSPPGCDSAVSAAQSIQMLQNWRATPSKDPAVQVGDLARIMRAINVSIVSDYAFLGIVELPTSLESKGCDLYRLIDDSQNQLRLSLHNFLETLDREDVDSMKTYVSLACQKMWLFFQLPDSSLGLVLVSEKDLTLFWPGELDWQHGGGLLLAGIALTLAALESKSIFQHIHQMEIYQVATGFTTSSMQTVQDMNTIMSQSTLVTEFSLAHFQAWALFPHRLDESRAKKLVRSKFGHNCGYVCVQKNEARTLNAFLHVGSKKGSE